MKTRLFVSAPLGNGAVVTIDGERARYLGRVLRLNVGDELAVFNGEDGEWLATIRSLQKNRAELQIVESRDTQTESPFRTHLVQGISRGERMDFVVQKATELGVKRITPVFTEYGVVRLKGERAEKRREHWQRVAESACEQSGRVRPPLVDAPIALNSWFGEHTADGSTQLILQPGAATPLSGIAAPVVKVCLLVGPEGGFSDREAEDAGVAGFHPVSLGPRVLRTETAALAALAILQSRWGDLGAQA